MTKDTATTSIVWGPAITASSLSDTQTSITTSIPATSTVTTQSLNNSDEVSQGFSPRSREILLVTTIAGGAILVALLIYAMWRRHRSTAPSKNVRSNRRYRSTSAEQPLKEKQLTALPTYNGEALPARSSYYPSVKSGHSPSSHLCRFSSPYQHVSEDENSHYKHMIGRHPHTLRVKPSFPATAVTVDSRRPNTPTGGPAVHSGRSELPANEIFKGAGVTIAVSNPSTDALEASKPTSSRSSRWDRWSWTNSQAPATPRLVAERDSSSSLDRLRAFATWKRAPSRLSQQHTPPTDGTRKKLVLKNQAALPVLGPPPPKSAARSAPPDRLVRVGSLSSIFRPHPGSLIPAPLSPRLEAQR